jgi:hypothetical protein
MFTNKRKGFLIHSCPFVSFVAKSFLFRRCAFIAQGAQHRNRYLSARPVLTPKNGFVLPANDRAIPRSSRRALLGAG